MKYLYRYCTLLVLLLLSTFYAFAQPNAGFSASPIEGCAPLSVQFTSQETGNAFTHTWNFSNGAGTINNAPKNPSTTYINPGTYTVTHTITGPGGTGTLTKTNYITVHPTPTVNFSGTPLTGCPPFTVNFTDLSTPGTTGTPSYYWVFGNGAAPATSTGKNPSAVYSLAGSNNVTLKVTNSKNCVASVTKPLYINVKEKPVVSFVADSTDFCQSPGTVTFTPTVTGGAGGPYIYLWEFGGPGNPTSNATSPTHTYTGTPPVQYTVKLTVTGTNGCSETVTRTNYIKFHKPNASFTGPSTVCLYSLAQFTNTSATTGATYEWNYGDGSLKETVVDGSHKYALPGIYTVTLTTTIGGCINTATKTIQVLPQPNPQVIMTPDSVCPAPQTICFNTIPSMSAYKWYFDDGIGVTTSTSATPCHTYTKNGHYPVMLEIQDALGCKDTFLQAAIVKIYELNIEASANFRATPPSFYADSGCVPFPVKYNVNLYRDSGIAYPYPVARYKWNFGNGDTSNQASPLYVYTVSGNYQATVEVYTKNGCIIRDTLNIKAGNFSYIDSIKASDTIICPNSSVNFRAYVRGSDTLIYKWDFDADGIRTVVRDSTISHIFHGGPPCVDTFKVKLTLSHRGCLSAVFKEKTYVFTDTVNNKKDTVTYKATIAKLPPCANFIDSIHCTNKYKVKFKNLSKGDSSRLWRFGDGDTSTLYEPTHTYTTKGYYTVWLIVYNSKTNCKDSIRKTIYSGDNKPDIIANKTQLCRDDSVEFWSYMNGDTSLARFDWYINGVNVANNKEYYKHTFNIPGVYTVMVISTHPVQLCRDTVIKTNWITVGGPTVGFVAANTKLCYSDTVKFTDTSFAGQGTSIVNRFWNFGVSPGDTLSTTANKVNRIYGSVGDFDVKFIVTDNLGCKDSAFTPQYIHVHKPVAAFTAQSPACVGADVFFGDISTNARKYYWTFGDGGTDTVNAPGHKYTTIGTFYTELIVTDSIGCKDTTDRTIVTTKPIADFTMSDSMSVCPPLIVHFDGTSSVRERTYSWDFDDGTSPGFKSTNTVVYNSIKEYKIKLIVTDSIGCKDSITKSVQVLGYAGAFTYDPIEGCAPLTVNFTSLVKGSVPTMIWDYGDGNTLLGSQSQPNVSYTYRTPGRYLPKMIFNNNMGCVIGSEGLDTILVDGSIADFETGPACQFSQVQFINKSRGEITPINITNWTFHDGSYSALKDPKRNYGPPGKYKVKLYVSNVQGCKDSIEKDITINVPIEITALADTIICLKDSAQLFPSGGVSYIWSPTTTLSCADCPNPFAFPKVKTKYFVISTDVNGCHDSTDVDVDIKTHVTSIVGEGGEICQGESITLNVSGARSYSWSPAYTVNDGTSPNPTASPNETTKYRVIAYEGSCIPDTSHVEVVVHPKPTVSVRGEKTIVAGTSADLLASGDNIVRFLWSPANTLSCDNCADPVASPFKTTIYTVKVTSKFECVDSAKVTITVMCDESQLFIPNTFTPNGDGINDIFMVRGNGISTLQTFRVYNRWGEIMFERTNVTVNDKQYGWDGTLNGTKLPPDVYVYTVEANCENGELLKIKGDVTIIR